MLISRFLSTVSLLLVATAPVAVHADTFDFSAIGVSGPFSGFGTLTANPHGANQFLITAITGTGVAGLIAPNGFRGNNNLLFPSNMPTVDSNGSSFTDVNGPDHFNVNIFDDGAGYVAYIQDEENFTQFLPANFTVSTLPAIPEPSTFFLLGTGLLGAAAMLRRRSKSEVPPDISEDVYENNDPATEDLSIPIVN